jgi:Tfp pilus assembly protein PilO
VAQKKGISKVLLIVSCLLVVAMLVAIYLQFGTMRQKQAAVAAEELALNQARSKLQSMKALAEKEDEFRENLVVLGHLMPGSAEEEKLIVDMQSAADLSELHFSVIRFGESADKEGYKALPVTMTYEGQFHGLLNLLEYVSVYERAVRIEELRIQLGAEPPDITVNVKASVFYAGE